MVFAKQNGRQVPIVLNGIDPKTKISEVISTASIKQREDWFILLSVCQQREVIEQDYLLAHLMNK